MKSVSNSSIQINRQNQVTLTEEQAKQVEKLDQHASILPDEEGHPTWDLCASLLKNEKQIETLDDKIQKRVQLEQGTKKGFFSRFRKSKPLTAKGGVGPMKSQLDSSQTHVEAYQRLIQYAGDEALLFSEVAKLLEEGPTFGFRIS